MYNYLKTLSQEYNLSFENVLSIAINRYGIIIDNFPDQRIRFKLKFNDNSQDTFFAVCVNTYLNSPFTLKDNNLYLEDKIIGTVTNIEKDTCTSTYFRNNKKAITFNSNARSKCVGCKFCGTYSLSDEDNYDFSTKDNIKKYFEKLLLANDIGSMQQIKDVTVCTGCFNTEEDLVKHLLLLNESFKEMNFNGRINYIGSQLRSPDQINRIINELGLFGFYLTIEKFLEREKYMRPEKASLTLDRAKALLEYVKSLGAESTFLYILGLEDLDTIKKYFTYFKDSVNVFPITQVFQDYTPFQETYRHKEANDIRYYLDAKKSIETIFKDSDLDPKLWQCYRSLYFDDEAKKKAVVRCKQK